MGMETTEDTEPQGLDDYLLAHDGLSDEVEETGKIPNEEELSKALRELGRLRQRMEANSSLAAARRTVITEWETEVNTPLQKRSLWLRSVVEARMRVVRDGSGDKKKSLTTPYGKVSTRAAQPKWEIEAAEFLAWALDNAPDLVEIKPTPRVAEIKKLLKPTPEGVIEPVLGEIVPGITVVAPEQPYTVTIEPN